MHAFSVSSCCAIDMLEYKERRDLADDCVHELEELAFREHGRPMVWDRVIIGKGEVMTLSLQ